MDTIQTLAKLGFQINNLFIGMLLKECRFDSRTPYFFKVRTTRSKSSLDLLGLSSFCLDYRVDEVVTN